MKKNELSNLDIVSNKDGVWLYLYNLFYPLHEPTVTSERRGRSSIKLAGATMITTLQDSGDLWEEGLGTTTRKNPLKERYVPVEEVHPSAPAGSAP